MKAFHPKLKRKTEAIEDFGKDLGWKVEEEEITNIGFGFDGAGGYQTADETDEDAYPQALKRYQLVLEKPNASIEESYYWVLNWLRQDLGYPQVEKIYDVFNASESSAMFGNTGQKLAIQQDRAAQYLRGISELVRTLFSIVRELRVIDERLELYDNWDKKKSADITLKHLYVSLVEQGGNNPDSVYSLARQMNFTVLPDLFFNTHIYKLDNIDKEVDSGQLKEFNKTVKVVLKRKLYQYISWKEQIEKETISRRRFQIQYLRQHWQTIQLYMAWVRPYLKTAARMAPHEGLSENPDFIGAFDTTQIEIEILAKKRVKMSKKDGHYRCILATFKFNTKPTLTYKQEYGSQVAAHSGKVSISFRAYGWHQEDIDAYKKMRRAEDFQILRGIVDHVGGSFDALGDAFEKYLEEAGDEEALAKKSEREKEKEEEAKAALDVRKQHNKYAKFGPIEPFIDVGLGIGELFGSFFKSESPIKKENNKQSSGRNEEILKAAAKSAAKEMGVLFQVYKKAHQMLNW